MNSWIASEEFEKRGTEGTSSSSVAYEMLAALVIDVRGYAPIRFRSGFSEASMIVGIGLVRINKSVLIETLVLRGGGQ